MITVNMNNVVGQQDILFIVLDTLRFDVAQQAFEQGLIPHIANYLPTTGWEQRHSPATFTYPAHHAFFAGFLPTPIAAGHHPRLFAPEFIGSESISTNTWQFQEADIVTALRHQGYHTSCIGGVGFFNKKNAIGSVFPNLFHDSYWSEATSVTGQQSTQHQVDIALQILQPQRNTQRHFIFINISALHQPNYFYLEGASTDNIETQVAALSYVDQQLERLLTKLSQDNNTFCILCSDHGTCYGEDGYTGHKLAHDVVLNVPYSHFFITHDNE